MNTTIAAVCIGIIMIGFFIVGGQDAIISFIVHANGGR